jgi:hypothetical protein
MSGISQATFSKLKVPTDITEKFLQNPANSAQLSNIKKQSDGGRETAGISAFCYIPSLQR